VGEGQGGEERWENGVLAGLGGFDGEAVWWNKSGLPDW
jgi:hypothetical protein